MKTNQSDVTYTCVEPSAILLAAAACAVEASNTEEFRALQCEVVAARNLTAASALELFGTMTSGLDPIDPATIWRVDDQIWLCTYKLDHRNPWRIDLWEEHIHIDEKTLLDGDVFTYGLGLEYHWLEWGDDQQTTMEIDDVRVPPTVLDSFCELVESDWAEDIREHFEEEFPPERQLRHAILKVIAAT